MTKTFEEMLKETFKRVAPPSGLEQRILAAAKTVRPKQINKSWLAIAAGLLLAAMVPGGIAYYNYRVNKAAEQVMFALQLTSRKLDHAFELAFQKNQKQATRANEEEKL